MRFERVTLLLLSITLFAACGSEAPPPAEKPAWTASEPEPLQCVPNLDGQIAASELKAAIDVPVRFVLNPAGSTRPVDIAGVVDTSGKRVWDLGASYADDAVAQFSAKSISGRWYASSFPGGQFALAADPSGAIEGIYAHSD